VRPVAKLLQRGSNLVFANIVVRIGALVSLAVATLIVARTGGPKAVGVYALLRVLPGLAGVLISAGLPGAVAYFLAGPQRDHPRLRTTIVAIATTGGLVGALLWVMGAQPLTGVFFQGLHPGLVAWAGLTVLTQLFVATAKACCQGYDDLPGANLVILLEELLFLPAYVVVLAVGVRGYAAMVAALLLADVATAIPAWLRLAGRGFFHDVSRPSLALAREVAAYGIRGQIGGVLLLLNLRLDFTILAALAGPAVLGTYAIASKFAELLKLPGLAFTYVLYPQYARDGGPVAAARARALLPRAGALVAVAALPLALVTGVLLPRLYGEAFRPAIIPAYILIIGLAPEGLAGVATAFLYGGGRPGLNSLAMGFGVMVTVVLDILLIPRFQAVGAAVASSAAYLTTTCMLIVAFWMVRRSYPTQELHVASAQNAS
jgi:O-antigen/teichoic acid export membrane protein